MTINFCKYHSGEYSFYIELIKQDKSFYYEIVSVHNRTTQISTITNLNYILSELQDYLAFAENSDETTWKINNKVNAMRIWKFSKKLFRDSNFIIHLEKRLTEDRSLGGWNSTIKF